MGGRDIIMKYNKYCVINDAESFTSFLILLTGENATIYIRMGVLLGLLEGCAKD